MKIEFDSDGNPTYDEVGSDNYIEVLSNKNGVTIVLSSRDPKKPLNKVVNSVILSSENFRKLISDVIK